MKASEHWMGLNHGEDVLAFEIHVPKVNNESMFEKSAAVYDEIVQMTLQKYNGRPHWGKNSSPIFVGIGPDQYERWDDFMALKAELDPAGRFENKIWRQLMGSRIFRASKAVFSQEIASAIKTQIVAMGIAVKKVVIGWPRASVVSS